MSYKNKEWLNEQYINQKKSTTQIGKDCNCKAPTIRYWMIKFDIPRRTISEAKNIVKKDYHSRDWLYDQYINQRKSTVEIGRESGVSNETIGYWLEKRNIQRRTISGALDGKFIGDKNPNWKGDNATDLGKYHRIHKRIKKVKPKPDKCEDCDKKTTKLQLTFNHFHKDANPIYYTETPEAYTYRCVSCHRKYDHALKTGGCYD